MNTTDTVTDKIEEHKRSAQQAVRGLRDALCASMVERDAEVEAVLLGLVSQQHVLLLGDPGEGKSMLARSFTEAIDGASVFQKLLDKFTFPDECFGPIKLSAMKEDRCERNVAGYAPTAEIIFADEIFKSSSALLNCWLELMNERTFDNGGVKIKCPLRILVGASNEVPTSENGRELGAFFDRFLIRRTIKPVSPAGLPRLLFERLPKVGKVCTMADVDYAAGYSEGLAFSEGAKEKAYQILAELSGEGIRPSSRRKVKGVRVAKAAAFMAGEDEVQVIHLESWMDIMWTDPAQAGKAGEIVQRIANPVGSKLSAIKQEVHETLGSMTEGDKAKRLAGLEKLGEIVKACEKLAAEPGANGQVLKFKKHVEREVQIHTARAMGLSPERIEALIGKAE